MFHTEYTICAFNLLKQTSTTTLPKYYEIARAHELFSSVVNLKINSVILYHESSAHHVVTQT